MNIRSRIRQKGAALAVAMILTTTVSAIGLSAASMTLHSERQSSNAVQQSDVFAAAEAGAMFASAALRAVSAAGVEIPESGEWAGGDISRMGGVFADEGSNRENMIPYSNRSGYWIERVMFFDDRVVISSRAASEDGLGRRGVQLTLNRDGGAPGIAPPVNGTRPGGSAITACEGVSVTGSGRIVSVDSQDPSYAGNEADVYTVGPNANIAVTGGAAINGSLRATGGIDVLGSSRINGGAVGNGNVLLTGGSYIDGAVQTQGNINVAGGANVFVGGDAYAGGNIRIEAAQIRGNATAGGNLNMVSTSAVIRGGATIAGTANLFENGGGKVQGFLSHGGISGQQNWQTLSDYAEGGNDLAFPEVPLPDEQVASDCDPLDVATMNADMHRSAVNETGTYAPNGYWDPARGAYISRHPLTDVMPVSGGPTGELHVQGALNVVNNQQVDFPDVRSLYLRVDGNMLVSGGSQIHIPANSDVTLVIDGDLNLNGDGGLRIGANSTLTIHTSGKMNVDGAGFVVMDGNPLVTNQDGDLSPRVQVFSDYSSSSTVSPHDHNSSGFKIGGASHYYATVYAPHTDVSIIGSGQITGSVWGQRIKVPGAAVINYDVALRGLVPPPVAPNPGGATPGTPLVLTIARWQES